MTELYKITDNLIRLVKQDARLRDVRFEKAYRKAQAHRPVSGFLGVVNFRKVECEMSAEGDIYKTELEIILYSSESGEELGVTALNLIDALRAADTDGFIANVTVGAIDYDSNNGAIYRSINAQLSTIYNDGVMKKYSPAKEGESSTTNSAVVYKDGVKLSGVTSFNAKEEFEKSESHYEMLCAEPWLSTARKKEYSIEIGLSGDDLEGTESGFVLTAEYDNGCVSYTGCTVISSQITVNDSESHIRKYKITATERVSAQ
ncbi:MAG: hypothetical protein J1E96_07400 [Ruminococcus sp.]|nr:hypothetical protein [Ruminococcus sp.]